MSCRSCNAPILWAVTERGKRIPLDPEPVDDGNIELVGQVAVYVPPGKGRYVSHFATCPNAASHRRAS